MNAAAGMIRECSNEKTVTIVKDYIELIGSRSFRSFDKKKADLEFAENAYNAILNNIREQTLVNLNNNYDNLKSTFSGYALKQLETEYKKQLEICNDMEKFEDFIIRIMKAKFNSVLTNQFDSSIITSEYYNQHFIGDSDDDLESFKIIYKNIFYNWLLGDSANEYGYSNNYGISLQELTNGSISSLSLKNKTYRPEQGVSTGEIIFAVSFFAILISSSVALIFIKRKEKR